MKAAIAALKPDHRYTRRGFTWSVAELRKLGKVPDSVQARRTKRTMQEVVVMRQQRRIRLPQQWRWTTREIKMLGRLNDRELARRLQRPHHQVRKQRTMLHIPPLLPRTFRKCTRGEEK